MGEDESKEGERRGREKSKIEEGERGDESEVAEGVEKREQQC